MSNRIVIPIQIVDGYSQRCDGQLKKLIRMKRVLYLFFVLQLLSSQTSYAIDKNAKYTRTRLKAERSFDALSFVKAIKYYEAAIALNEDDFMSRIKIAESYRLMNDAENAAKWYKEAFDMTTSVDKQYKLNYAQVLSSLGEYEDAKVWYKIGRSEDTQDLVKEKLKGIQNLDILLRDSLVYSIQPALVNSSDHDFSPAYYKEGIVFASNRPSSGLFKPTYQWDNTNYLDLFYSDMTDKTKPGEPVELPRIINSR